MPSVPTELKYSKSHEWVRVDGEIATVGISDQAQSELGDIVYLDLPEAGRIVAANAPFGEVESVKAVSELYAPVSGEVVETNEAIRDATEAVNADPYGHGWLVKIRMSAPSELSNLLDAAAYTKFAAEGGH